MSTAPLLERLIADALDTYRPAEARAGGGRALFDHLCCLTAGRRVVGREIGDAGAAAVLDRDDLHWPSLTHPGAIVWTVLRTVGAEGESLWRGAHAGYEVTTRLARGLGEGHRRFWHATTTAGTVGGAVAAALALEVDPLNAAAHAVSVTGGSIVCLLERADTRIVHRDHAAATALRCARMGGLSAPRDGLEHPRGMFAAMGGDADALLARTTGSALCEISFRRHATCGFSQALVEAAGELGPLAGPEPALLQAPAETVAMAGIAAPRDPEEAWWSARHAVAVTLLGLDLEDATLVHDPAVIAQIGQTRLEAGPVSRVTVAGRTAERERAAPLSDRDLLDKWSRLNPGLSPPEGVLA